MKILLVVPSVSRVGGGVSEVVRLTAEALGNIPEAKVEIATLRDEWTSVDQRAFGSTVVRAFRAWPPRRFGFSPGLLLYILRARPDIIHLHALWQFHAAAVLLWSLFTGRPYVVTAHGMLEIWILKRSPKLKTLVGLVFHKEFLRRACCFQALTAKEVKDICAAVPNAVCRVIPNYAPRDNNPPPSRPVWWCERMLNRNIFLFYGRIHEKKGCLELLRAWDEACESSVSLRNSGALVFCGWNDSLARFEKVLDAIAARRGNVFFGGPQFGEDRRRTLNAATFVVLPSYSEGLPMVILEAWAAGKPVLMTAACNLNIGFKYGAAIEVEADVHRLAEALLFAHELDSNRRNQMRDQALDLVEREFSATSVSDALMAMYTLALKK
jgi:glycosyltransferase involved in cell wall biosynthesis